MKPQSQDKQEKNRSGFPVFIKSQPAIIPMVVIGVLIIVTYITLVKPSDRTPDPIFAQDPNLESVVIMDEASQNLADLPPEIATAVREDVMNRTGISLEEIEILVAERQTWPDTCLGLANTDELCGQMLVEGWKLRVSDGQRHWFYRTNNNGSNFRLERN